MSKEVEQSAESRISILPPETQKGDPRPRDEQTKQRPTLSMIWAVKCRIDANRDTNSEIIKAETIVIIYEWHSSPEDDVAHITLHSRNLDGDRTGSYHGCRPGEQKLYRIFFKWAKNLPASVETPSEEDISRMPPALFKHWQDSAKHLAIG